MAELKQCEFFLVRYVPDALTGEYANIGVVLCVAQPPSAVHVRFTHDWRRVRCLDPQVDLDLLQDLERDLSHELIAGAVDRDTMITKLQDRCSNALQLTPLTACLAEDPQAEIETLARMYLEKRTTREARGSARHAIFTHMRGAFEQAGVWGLMLKKIPAAEYTHAGDPLKIDCGYMWPAAALPEGRQPKADNRIHLFHAVALSTDVDAAKVLAFSFPLLRRGMLQKQQARAELTAITEDGLDLNDPAIAFALATLTGSEVRVASTKELNAIADNARAQLQL